MADQLSKDGLLKIIHECYDPDEIGLDTLFIGPDMKATLNELIGQMELQAQFDKIEAALRLHAGEDNVARDGCFFEINKAGREKLGIK